MRRPRHRPRRSAGLSFSLLVAVAALCLVSLPALAQADSSEKQYIPDVPESGIPQAPKKKANGKKGPQAKASTQSEAKTESSESNGDEQSSESESDKKQGGAAAGGDGGKGGGGNAEKSAANGGSNQAQTGVGDEQSLGATSKGQNASHSDGGSSPLVPILIAVAVLAAISIGAVIYRQRRQDSGGTGSPVSPNA